MGIFSFLFPKKITDEYFGVLKYGWVRTDNGKSHYYDGNMFFKSANAAVDITFWTDGSEPKLYQKELFKQVEKSYNDLLNKISADVVSGKYAEDIEEEKIENLDIKTEYVLKSVRIYEKTGEDFEWSLAYKFKGSLDIEIEAYFKNFEIDYIDFMNLGTIDDE